MKRIAVNSTLAESIGYDPENSILEVEFKDSGAVWQYEGVSKIMYYEMMKSSSIGSYFREYVKDHFPEKKMDNISGIHHSIKITAVDSSTMNAIGYHAALEKLRIVFRKDEVYDYKNVPSKVFEGLLKARSKGTFFNLHIKEKFPYERI